MPRVTQLTSDWAESEPKCPDSQSPNQSALGDPQFLFRDRARDGPSVARIRDPGDWGRG